MPRTDRARVPSDEFELVYRRELAFVWRVLRYHGVADEAVEDCAQEVFLVAHRRWHVWDRSRSIRAWLFGVARRVAATHRRGARRRRSRLAALPSPDSTTAIDRRAVDRERLRRLVEIVETMDTKLATVFVLADIEGVPVAEIARAQASNRNTTYWRLRKARALVNAAFEDLEDDDDQAR